MFSGHFVFGQLFIEGIATRDVSKNLLLVGRHREPDQGIETYSAF